MFHKDYVVNRTSPRCMLAVQVPTAEIQEQLARRSSEFGRAWLCERGQEDRRASEKSDKRAAHFAPEAKVRDDRR